MRYFSFFCFLGKPYKLIFCISVANAKNDLIESVNFYVNSITQSVILIFRQYSVISLILVKKIVILSLV